MNKPTKRLLYTTIVVLALAALAAPKLSFFADKIDAPGDGGGPQNAIIPVEAFVVGAEKVELKIFATGTVVANEEVELRSEISGMVTGIFFEEGSRVQKGEQLLKINDADLQAQLLKQQYQLELATDRENRQKKLLEQNLISRQNYDLALNELNTVRSEIAFLEAQLQKTKIEAPFDGIIGLKYISQGSYISPSTRIANLININPVKIDFSVPEKYANYMHKGDDFRYKIVGSEGDHKGKVLAVEPRIDTSTRTLQVRGISPNKTGEILPGAFAEVELVVQDLEDAIMVPTVALIPELQGQKVFLVKQKKAAPKYVTTGIRTETKVQIIDGLAPGDTLITSGILQIRTGSEVSITDFQNTTS